MQTYTLTLQSGLFAELSAVMISVQGIW